MFFSKKSDKKSSSADKYDAKWLRTVKNRFLSLSHQRLQATFDSLRGKQLDFFELIPLLIHANHPLLPGFQSANTPSGICDYTPSDSANRAVKKFVRGFSGHGAHMRREILGVYAMGSPGTVGYTAKSDIDFWVCYRDDLDNERLIELNTKLEAISKAAEAIGLEIHFFLMQPEGFRKGQQSQLDEESSGSAQHILLLDEFYRTGLLLAGLPPIWWLVPEEHEANYQAFLDELTLNHLIRDEDWVDFGPIPTIPAEEFLGAAFWQLYKAVHSPYKSVMKLMLMEVYGSEYPDVIPLSLQFKSIVHQSAVTMAEVDPYILMYRRVEAYLEPMNDNRLGIVRRCLYLKANLKMSRSGSADEQWRRAIFEPVVKAWNWNIRDYKKMDSRRGWRVLDVDKEKKAIQTALMQSYRQLSHRIKRMNVSRLINKQDLDLLGRKLLICFEHKQAGKIELINQGIAPDISEEILSFHQVMVNETLQWVQFAGHVPASAVASGPRIHKDRSLFKSVTWAYFNGILTETTQVSLPSQFGTLQKQLRSYAHTLQDMVQIPLPAPSPEALRASGVPEKLLLFINLGEDKMESFAQRGMHLVSERSDPLSYGSRGLNLIECIDLILINSWKEVFATHYRGPEAILDSLMYILRKIGSKTPHKPQVHVVCSGISRAESIARRVQKLLNQVLDLLFSGTNSMYLLEINQQYRMIDVDLNGSHIISGRNAQEVLSLLSQPRRRFVPLVFDPHVHSLKILSSIYEKNKQGQVQLFLRVIERQFAEIYVIDELGGLFYEQQPFHTKEGLVNQYRLFFKSVMFRQQASEVDALLDEPELYEVQVGRGNESRILRYRHPSLGAENLFHQVAAVGQYDPFFQVQFDVYCDQEEFTYLDLGEEVFSEAARFIVGRRRHHEDYPAYITDLDLSAIECHDGTGALPTSQYLRYKKQLDEKLNRRLRSIK